MDLALMPLAVDVGGYINLYKLIPVLLVMMVWGKILTWIDKDAVAAHMPREGLNSAILGMGVLGFALFFLLPGYPIALLAMAFLMLSSVSVYFILRKKKTGSLEDVWKEFALWRSTLLSKKKKGDAEAPAGQVQIFSKGGKPVEPPKSDAPGRPGYDAAQNILTDPLKKAAERIEVKPTEGAAAVVVTVDGVSYNAPSMDRTLAGAGVSYLKWVAQLDLNEKRKPQKAGIKASLDKSKFDLEIETAGNTLGEFLRVDVDPKKRHGRKIDELGFFPEQLAMVKETIAEGTGVVILTAPKGQGLSSMLYAVLRAHDAFLTHIQSLERFAMQDVEGITQTKVAPNMTPAEELQKVEWIISQQPDTVMLDTIANPATARALIKFADEGKRVYVGMRGASAFEALATWRKMVGDDAMAVKNLRLIVAGRVMRRLCSACKVAYSPNPEQLRKLNLDPAKVTRLYQARTQPVRNEKGEPVLCTFCQELRFKGRFGVFEFLTIDDALRQAILAGGSDNQIKAVFRKQRGMLMQEAALRVVEQGETSVQEVLRALRPPDSGGQGGQGAAARRPAPAAGGTA